MKKKNLPNNCISVEDLKKRNPRPGSFNFEGFMQRPEDDNLVKKVQESMQESLGREVSSREAQNHIRICDSIAKARNQVAPSNPKTVRGYRNRLFRLDEVSAEGGNRKTLRDWCFYWDKVTDFRVMASAGDFYLGCMELIDACASDNKEIVDRGAYAIDNLIQDLHGKSGMILSSRLDFQVPRKMQQNALGIDVEITHHYNCKYKNQTTRINSVMPLGSTSINNLVDLKHLFMGQEYVQDLFYTHDDLYTIAANLGLVTDTEEANIKINVTKLKDIRDNPHRCLRLVKRNDRLYILNSALDREGMSRGYFRD